MTIGVVNYKKKTTSGRPRALEPAAPSLVAHSIEGNGGRVAKILDACAISGN